MSDSAVNDTPVWRSRTFWFVIALLFAGLAAGASFFLPKMSPSAASLVPTLEQSIVGPLGSPERRIEGDPMAIGSVDAPVAMVMFSDYLCPFCARFANETEHKIVAEYVDKGLVRLEWRDLPLFGDPSYAAAWAGRAAAEQGRFWEFMRELYAGAPAQGRQALDRGRFLAIAERAGVPDLEKFAFDLENPALGEGVLADARQAEKLEITGTPAFSINGHFVSGARPFEAFASVIDELLAQN